jgi:hypothetical protein
MAFVAAIPAIVTAVGGGSLAAGSIALASAAVTAYAGVRAANEQRAAGKATQIETQMAASAEGDAARQREIERKRNLLRAISSQVAASGAAGVKANEGSPGSLLNLDIKYAGEDQNVDTANVRSQMRALQFRGSNAVRAGNAASTTTLLDTAGRTAGMFLKH